MYKASARSRSIQNLMANNSSRRGAFVATLVTEVVASQIIAHAKDRALGLYPVAEGVFLRPALVSEEAV